MSVALERFTFRRALACGLLGGLILGTLAGFHGLLLQQHGAVTPADEVALASYLSVDAPPETRAAETPVRFAMQR